MLPPKGSWGTICARPSLGLVHKHEPWVEGFGTIASSLWFWVEGLVAGQTGTPICRTRYVPLAIGLISCTILFGCPSNAPRPLSCYYPLLPVLNLATPWPISIKHLQHGHRMLILLYALPLWQPSSFLSISESPCPRLVSGTLGQPTTRHLEFGCRRKLFSYLMLYHWVLLHLGNCSWCCVSYHHLLLLLIRNPFSIP